MLQSQSKLKEVVDRIEQMNTYDRPKLTRLLSYVKNTIASMKWPQASSRDQVLYQESQQKAIQLVDTFLHQLPAPESVLDFAKLRSELVLTLRIVINTFQLHVKTYLFHQKLISS